MGQKKRQNKKKKKKGGTFARPCKVCFFFEKSNGTDTQRWRSFHIARGRSWLIFISGLASHTKIRNRFSFSHGWCVYACVVVSFFYFTDAALKEKIAFAQVCPYLFPFVLPTSRRIQECPRSRRNKIKKLECDDQSIWALIVTFTSRIKGQQLISLPGCDRSEQGHEGNELNDPLGGRLRSQLASLVSCQRWFSLLF